MHETVAPTHRRWVNRSVAREFDRDRVRWLWGLCVVLLLAAAPFAAYLLEQNECLRLSYVASALRERREELMEQERRLRMERAALESLSKIEAWAVGRHGLVHPSPGQVVVVRQPSPNSQSAGPVGSTPQGTGHGRER